MNRQQRRMLERSARQTAQRRIERPVHFPMIVKVDTVIRPLEAIIDQIERFGTVDVTESGLPVFKPTSETTWFATAPAVEGLADAFEMWGTRHAKAINVAPLRVLAHALATGAEITQTNLADLHALMPRLRAIAARFGHDEAKDIIQQTQIKAELEGRFVP